MKQLGQAFSLVAWLLVAISMVIITGSLMGRPLLLAAVPTGSMTPVLNPGDLIVVLPTWAKANPQVGEIIVFKTERDRDWVVHRIVEGDANTGFVTQGDANRVPDPGRVKLTDIAGVVPQWGDRALSFPRLGLLSVGQGPLSSPVVAGVALVVGLYLLVLDARAAGQSSHRRIAKGRAQGWATLQLYAGLAGVAFVTTLIPAYSLSTRGFTQYEVVLQHPSNNRVDGRYILGENHTEPVTIKNPSPLPLMVVFSVRDPNVTYDPPYALLAPYGERTFTTMVLTPELGKFEHETQMGVFLPLLPPGLIHWLGQYNMALGALVVALVPAVLIILLALLDARSRMAWQRLYARAAARFTA